VSDGPFDLTRDFAHLGLGARVEILRGFEWSEEYLARYVADHADDGDDGRLVMIGSEAATWTSWERHPAGDELVVLLSGRCDVIQEIGGEHRLLALEAGGALVNPRGIWHTADVHEPGNALFITPGRGTQHRPRT
jgi:uncharacterized cupin superfamily protein